jgi:hypothetical protein
MGFIKKFARTMSGNAGPRNLTEYEAKVNPVMVQARTNRINAQANLINARIPAQPVQRQGVSRAPSNRFRSTAQRFIGTRSGGSFIPRARVGRSSGGNYSGRSSSGYQGKKGYASRGRPRGPSGKYFIPGRGPVDVFTWRKYMSAMRRANTSSNIPSPYPQQRYSKQPFPGQGQFPQQPQQFMQQGIPMAQDAPEMQGAIVNTPDYDPYPKEMKVFHNGNPLGIDKGYQNAPDSYFYEVDLFSGQPKLRKQGELV